MSGRYWGENYGKCFMGRVKEEGRGKEPHDYKHTNWFYDIIFAVMDESS